MKKFLLLSLTALVSLMTNARQLTPQEALSRALGAETAGLTASRASSFTLSYTSTDPATGNAGVYVFNTSGDNGYAVISADDVAEALLGYADEGRFDPENIPANMKAWLETYTAEIVWASTQSLSEGISTYTSTRPERSPIPPLCKTKWDQSAPYNNECPIDPRDNKRCVTGCVATAMAQVMKYHNWPQKGSGALSYTTSTLKIQQSLDLSSITFDWGNMLDVYTGSATPAQEKAVATLMHAAGVSVNMDYTSVASSAGSHLPAKALIEYFGYDKGVSFQRRYWYGLTEWEDLIYENLTSCGPVIIGGSSFDGGHEFVCDGYSQDGYFHINWGWGGMSDGYFLLSALEPGQQGIGGSSSGYNIGVEAILGIRKPSGLNEVTPIFGLGSELSGSANNNTLTLNGGFWNFSYSALKVTYGVQVTDNSNNTSYFGSILGARDLNVNTGFNSYSTTLNLPAGTYTVRPAFKVEGNGEWQLMKADISMINYLVVTIGEDGNITSASQPTNAVNTIITDLKPATPLISGNAFRVTAKITNNGTQEYLNGLALIIQKDDANYSLSKLAVDIMPGENLELNFYGSLSSQTFPAGTYKMLIGRVSGNGFIPVTDPVDITVEAKVDPILTISDISVDDANDVALDNITVRMKVSNTGGYYYGTFIATIFPENGGTCLDTFKSPYIEIPAGAKNQEVVFSGSFPTGQVGSTYALLIPDINGNLSWDRSAKFTVGSTTGIESIELTSETRILDIYTLTGIRASISTDIRSISDLDNSSLAPGTYIIVTMDANGNRKSAKYLKR